MAKKVWRGSNRTGALQRNDRGAIEGLPLYLLIIVIITAVSIGIVFGMLGLAKPPQALGSVSLSPQLVVLSDRDGDGTWTNESVALTIIVTDSSGNRLPGAVVTLTGNGIKTPSGTNPYATTNSDGMAVFTGLKCSVVGSGAGPIVVTIEKAGYGKKVMDVPVVQA
ncbi:MAG: carboxypeptidase-like regulatory domain-containing protein [Thermoplasmatota archaeon]